MEGSFRHKESDQETSLAIRFSTTKRDTQEASCDICLWRANRELSSAVANFSASCLL